MRCSADAVLTAGTKIEIVTARDSPLAAAPSPVPAVTVRSLGWQLMGPPAAALLATGVLLTVALIGAVVIAAGERPSKPGDPP